MSKFDDLPFRRNEAEIYHPTRVKFYPDGSREIMSCSRPVFRDPGWVLSDCSDGAPASKSPKGRDSVENLKRAARRAAAKVRDLALCNDFVWFVTLTLDRSKIDRYDLGVIVKRLNVWLDNHVRRDGLKYLLVPELHKDGAVHFHGFFNDVPGMTPAGVWSVPGSKKPRRPRSGAELAMWMRDGDAAGFHEVFNYDGWPYGFTTAIRLYGEKAGAVAYIVKYVTKQAGSGKIGGRWYYSGGKLAVPDVVRCDLTLSQMLQRAPDAYRFEVEEAKLLFAVVREAGEFDPPGVSPGVAGVTFAK